MVMATERYGRYHILALLPHQFLYSQYVILKVIIIYKYILFCGFRISEHFTGIKFCNFHLTIKYNGYY